MEMLLAQFLWDYSMKYDEISNISVRSWVHSCATNHSSNSFYTLLDTGKL
jgi:hypothetical protein